MGSPHIALLRNDLIITKVMAVARMVDMERAVAVQSEDATRTSIIARGVLMHLTENGSLPFS